MLSRTPASLTAFTDRLHDNMHVRMWLVRMQYHRVPMLSSELFASEVVDGG
jgi:hypothetical protein